MRRTDRSHRSTRDVRTTVSITCVTDGCAHQVSDLQMGGYETDGRGRYRALCGHVVTAASLAEPDGTPCRACATSEPIHSA